ncbi:anti-sigma factor [Paenibacillus tarimensis]
MNCHEIQDLFGIYWDLPAHDPERMAIDRHLQQCKSCAEEFQIWEKSESLIRDLSDETFEIGPIDHVNRDVMDRIYTEESWFMPVSERNYQFSASFRRNVAAIIACCLAMFVCGFVYLLFGEQAGSSATQIVKVSGLLDTVNANEGISVVSSSFYNEVPVASISDPVVLKVVPTIPQYWVALSMLGIIMTLLILNWLSRTRT